MESILHYYADRPCLPDTHQFGPYEGDAGQDVFEQLRSALVKTAQAMMAAKVSPAFLSKMTWTMTPAAKHLYRGNLRKVDLVFREVFGGNYPVLTVHEDALETGQSIKIASAAALHMPDNRQVYRHFTKAELDRAYSARGAVPNHLDIFADWQRRSDDFRAQTKGQCITLAYGSAPSQKLDLYLPPTIPQQAGLPMHIFYHGGYWQALSKDEHGFLAAPFTNSGVAFVAVDYALCPQATLDDIFAESRRALIFLAENASRWRLNTSGWQVGGHSAGAQLAAMLATDEEISTLISSLVLISGIFDLEPLRHTGMNRVLGLNPEMVVRHSPLYLSPQDNPTVILAVGENESTEFQRQTNELMAAWDAKAYTTLQIPLPGANHFTALEVLADAESPLFQSALTALQS